MPLQEATMAQELGFVGIGHMGLPMATRLLDAGHSLLIFDARPEAMAPLVARGARAASSALEVANQVATVLISLPTPDIVQRVVLGEGGLAQGTAVRTVIDLSTTGATMAQQVHEGVAALGKTFVDSPVSGGVGGAVKGTLAVMVSCPRALYDELAPMLSAIGKPFFIGEQAGMAQTMKLCNNLLSAAAMAATAEAVGMGVKAGLDAAVMVDVINAGSGRSTASTDKFPRAVLTRSFDYGFATALMYKDVRLCMQEAKALGVPMPVAEQVHQVWQRANDELGGDKDFTTVVQLTEQAIGQPMQPRGA
jgi:3-hydroxyisobutyrate dehydrogenase-like beta-hydroxyacid dehydrogenase